MDRDTHTLMEPLFKYANRTTFNIAPERGQALADEIFKTARWKLTAMDGNPPIVDGDQQPLSSVAHEVCNGWR